MTHEEFRQARIELGIPQMKAATEAGIGVWYVNQYEKHGRPLKPEWHFKLHEWLAHRRQEMFDRLRRAGVANGAHQS